MVLVKFRRPSLKLLLALFAVSLICFLMVLLHDPDAGMCLDERIVWNIELNKSIVNHPVWELDNILSKDLSKSKNIFFLETASSQSNDDVSLNNRQACSIESAALLNPNAKISVVFITNSGLIRDDIVDTLSMYKNIAFYRMDLLEFSMETPLEDWIKSEVLYDTKFLMETISDVVRLQLLWRFGGIYLDLDVISLTSLAFIPANNFICAQLNEWSNWDPLNGAILSLDADTGRQLATMVMNEFVSNYNPDVWAWNGPFLLSKVLRPLCNTTKNRITEPVVCGNFTVFPLEKCYLFENWRYFFKEKHSRKTLTDLSQSYFAHYMNHANKNCKLSTKSSAALISLARDYCPNILQGDIF